MKKNRRGLGRGLGALIQSTVPEDESVETEDASLSESPDVAPEDAAAVGTQQLELDEPVDEGSDESAALDRRSSPDGPPDADEEPRVADAADSHGDSESIAHRYLGKDSPEPGPTVSRETRRPVDLFFPDRRVEPPSASEGRNQSARSSSSGNGRKRPTMPPLEPRVPRLTRDTAQDSVDREANQPQADEETAPAASPRTPPAESHAAPARSSAETKFSGTAENAELRSVAVADIHPNPRQPREVFDEDDMDELVASIREVGVLQPIVVRPVDGPSPYELVMGERRWRASQRAGMESIPAIVRHTADTALLRDALLENLHRSQLNPLEEAAAYEQLLEDFECTQDELSSRIGRSRPQISNTLRLLKLPPLVQRRVASGVLSAGHARALLGLVDPGEMEKLAQKVVSEGLSVRATEELVSLHDGIRQTKQKSRVPRTDRHERLDYLANSLTDQLDTTVKITLGARKGKIAIDFASVEDLNRIMSLINPTGADDA